MFDDNLKVDMDGANVKAISHFTACTNDAIVVYGEDDISETVNNIVEISDMDENYDFMTLSDLKNLTMTIGVLPG